mgnify:CR=1 FL=1
MMTESREKEIKIIKLIEENARHIRETTNDFLYKVAVGEKSVKELDLDQLKKRYSSLRSCIKELEEFRKGQERITEYS